MNKIAKASLLFILTLTFSLALRAAPLSSFSKSLIAEKLDWQPCSSSICGGYYIAPPSISTYKKPPNRPGKSKTVVESQAPVTFEKNNWSKFKGHTRVSQSGRLVTADQAQIYQDPETGRISQLIMEGNVHFYEPGKHLASNLGTFNLVEKTATLEEAFYRIYTKTPTGYENITGHAKSLERPNESTFLIYDGTYSTCSPINRVWEIRADKIALNQNTEWGVAKKLRLYFMGRRIFSFPYFTFPISNKRKTGFLFPRIGYSNRTGSFIGIPYYFNLAPNYDETFTTILSTQRVALLTSHFRYLTRKSHGHFKVDLLPYDPTFRRFIHNSTIGDFEGTNKPYLYAAFARLKNDKPTRANLNLHHFSQIDSHWKTDLHLNYVTDDYFFQDLIGEGASENKDQLINRLAVLYNSRHWDFSTILLSYQTLHPVNQPVVQNIYKRLPQLNLNAHWFDQKTLLDFALNTEFVHFEFNEFGRNFFPNDYYYPKDYWKNPKYHGKNGYKYKPTYFGYRGFKNRFTHPTGNRFHALPRVTWEKLFPSGFFKPSLEVDLAAYDLRRHSEDHISRAIPIASIDTGLYFGKNTKLFQKDYLQTLEPRLFYLYVPFVNQDDIPIFDTILPPFGFTQLFRKNRFIGFDRITNSNQISVGFTSRLLTKETGEEKARLNLGQIYYFDTQKVFLNKYHRDQYYYLHSRRDKKGRLRNPYMIEDGEKYYLDPYSNKYKKDRPKYSPLVEEFLYHISDKWRVEVNSAWDFYVGDFSNAELKLSWVPWENAVINGTYEFVRNINPHNIDDGNLNRLKFSTSLPLNQHWNLLAAYKHNIRPSYAQEYLAGLEYNDCCWAVRFLVSGVLRSEGQEQNQRKYDNNFYIQFQLKGLGNAGQSSIEDTIKKDVPGYKNPFFGG